MSLIPGELLPARYDMWSVGLSYVVSVLGSLVALECARRIVRADKTTDWSMLAAAAFSLGGVGIWTMHFVGMVAYRLPVPISYKILPTFVSLVAAIVISGIALYLAGGRARFSVRGWMFGSLLAGLGVCVMHYMGMYAQVMRATLQWKPGLVALSVVIAIAAAGAALWLAFNLHRFALRIAAALVMGVAVCAMHYTGMAAADAICTTAEPEVLWKLSGSVLQGWILGLAGVVLGVIIFAIVNRGLEAQFLATTGATAPAD